MKQTFKGLASERASENQRTPPANWQQRLKTLCQQDMTPQERHPYIVALRENLFPNPDLINHHKVTRNTAIPNLPTTTLLFLIKACRHLRDWPLVVHCAKEYQKRLDRTTSSNTLHHRAIDNLHLLSRAYQHLGLFHPAEKALQRAMGNGNDRADRQRTIDEYRQLQQRVKALPKGIDTLQADPLRLTPLQSHHEKDFLWQYADPKIAELCNLPNFDSEDEDWQQWLKANQEKSGDRLFAINHLYWGFIGSVSLELSREFGFFYYWLGADFQGYGYGPNALAILLDWASRHSGLRRCYATAYKDNIPSHKAMSKVGFRPLPLKVILPGNTDYEEDLFCWGDRQSDRLSLAEIEQLFIDRDFAGQVLPIASWRNTEKG